MAKELLPEAFWARIAPLLPPEPPKPKGGRPRVSDRAALTGILFVLKKGHPLGVPACRDGVWERDDVLAQAARLVPSGRLAQAAPGASRRAGPRPIASTGTGPRWTPPRCPAPGGQETGKNPTDRGKQGTKRHLVVDAHGIPLAVLASAANVHDLKMMLATCRRHRAHPRQDARQAPSPTAQAPCRQGLRLPPPPSDPAQAPDHPAHRPLWCRAQEPPGTLPLGGRTDALLAQPLPAPEDPLRAPG